MWRVEFIVYVFFKVKYSLDNTIVDNWFVRYKRSYINQ